MKYSEFQEALRWRTDGDRLFRDGVDHYQVDRPRFERAANMLGPLVDTTICDFGSFPGYGLWAFRNCRHYVGLGKCPDWYREMLVNKFGVDWLECNFEATTPLPSSPFRPDIVTLQEVIEHIRRPKAFLMALHSWMPSGSRLYLTTNNIHYIGYILKLAAGREIFDPVISEDSVYPGHCTYYSRDGLTRLMEDLGFVVLSACRINFLPSSEFYRRRTFAAVKNLLTRSATNRYASHLEIICRKP